MNEEGFELVKNSLSRNRRTATPVGQVVPTQQEIDELFVGCSPGDAYHGTADGISQGIQLQHRLCAPPQQK